MVFYRFQRIAYPRGSLIGAWFVENPSGSSGLRTYEGPGAPHVRDESMKEDTAPA